MISAGISPAGTSPTSAGGAKIGNTKRGFDEKSPGSAAGQIPIDGKKRRAVAEKPTIDIGLATDRLAILTGEAARLRESTSPARRTSPSVPLASSAW